MAITNALFREFVSVVTHLEGKKHALLSGHCIQDSCLHRCDLGFCIEGDHG
ncbi:MAG TPA: hypothetical protein VKE93_19960 [Candidatus Angelobacter sp.]|nr:hypothetical protein [Candidatus Angelobacter sp.]